MNLSQLEVLVAIVDTGSLTEAAEVVGLTQSAVSYSLIRLESALGVTLLERGRQGITVTRIGEEVVQHARNVLAQTEIIRQKTSRERGLSVGKVRFGIAPNIAGRLLTGILRDFQHQYPEIELVLFEGNPKELLEWLETGVVDVGAVLDPTGYIRSEPLAYAKIRVALPENHEMASREAFPTSALKQYPLVGPKAQYMMFRRMIAEHGVELPRLRYEVSSMVTILTMVREGMGICLIPELLYDSDLAEGLVILPLDPPLQLDVYLATYFDSPATKAFINAAHTWSKEHGFLT